jgi:tripartite-type tricarboxylate transporter receptor subunit TctC
MSIQRRDFIAAAAALASGAASSQGDAFPTRPIHIIVPSTPGGPTDRGARLLAALLKEQVSQPVIVENKPGAGGSLGYGYVAKAEKTGHVIGIMADSTVTNPLLDPGGAGYALADLTPLVPMYMGGLALAVSSDFPARTAKDFIALAQKNASTPISLGMYGTAASPRFGAELLMEATKIKLNFIPYKGESDAVRDLVGGVIPAFMGTTTPLLEQHRAGKVRILATTATERVKALSEVPTFTEEGFPGVVYGWFHGLMVPAGTPRPVVDRLLKELTPIIASERFRSGLGQDLTPVTMSEAEFRTMVENLRTLAARIIRERNLKP